MPWTIAEAWWRKTQKRAAGAVPEASSSRDYAENFWQGFVDEARAAIAALDEERPDVAASAYSGSAFLAPIG